VNKQLTEIEDAVISLLSSLDPECIDRTIIEKKVRLVSAIQEIDSESDIQGIIKKLEERFDISMILGTLFAAEDYRPWLDEKRGEIDWYYWSRYKRLLAKKGFPPLVINAIHADTDRILDPLEDPKKEASWSRKGLVVGHVQSGKTANYTGLICKAADAGYRLIIVLAGMSNPLRNQTQERIDEGFVGIETAKLGDNLPLKSILKGVGELNSDRLPNSFTTRHRDFDRRFAQTRGTMANSQHPFILVIKKNTHSFSNLIAWLKNNNLHLDQFPFLLVDDEADHASINTNKPELDPTTINKKITELLSLFAKSTYVGYTATPFANVFVDPGPNDIFPEDFIYSLNTPDNYVGSEEIFGPNSSLDIVREIDDYEDYIPLKHKRDLNPLAIPPSLKEAIIVFVLACAGRILRRQTNKHNSMLINVSVLKDIHHPVKLLVHEYLDCLREAIQNHYALPEHEALKNPILKQIKGVWSKEFSELEFDWKAFQRSLKTAAFPISVIEVNTSRTGESLNYEDEQYPKGRNVIAVGGYSLSRGLTLEGLTVSYILRNTQMYDTLMQMGRWFGYRDGYADLCRVYMHPKAASWYSHISGVTEELRSEFKRMERAGMTPKEFGLCVRSHPESLIITARNKMRSAKPILRQINLEGRIVESTVLHKTDGILKTNLSAVETIMSSAKQTGDYQIYNKSHLFKNVAIENIIDFFESFENHPASLYTESTPLIEYARWLSNEKGIGSWDILLLNKEGSKSSISTHVSGLKVKAQYRKVLGVHRNAVTQKNRRIGSTIDESAGLPRPIIDELESYYGNKSKIPASAFRERRVNPLLMFHLLDCRLYNQPDEPLFPQGIVGYGISFPGTSTTRRPEKLVEYHANTVFVQENGRLFEDEDMEVDDE